MTSNSKCCHINADLSICNRKDGYNSTNMCKLHFHDINCDRKESKIQSKRLTEFRKKIQRLKETGFYIGLTQYDK